MMTLPSTAVLPGATIGIVGGGQLGRMLALTARRFGYGVVVFTGGSQATPAGVLADHEVCGAFNDPDAVKEFVARVDVITWEFENVDTALAERAENAGVPVRPSGPIVATAQDRALEKRALIAAGVPVARWQEVGTAAELVAAVATIGLPVIAKTARFGYDGKGQVTIRSASDLTAAWDILGRQRLVVEEVVAFDRELSVVVARGIDGSVADHGVMENSHVNHILDSTMVPAAIAPATEQAAITIAHSIAEYLDLVGVLCVELFAEGTTLYVNEIAPRPHNSGHCTIEAAPASQFEQQLRAVCGLPLGDSACRPAAMVQLLGDLWNDGEPAWASVAAQPDIHLHLYGKGEPRPGRKMGHLTCLAAGPVQARQRATDARAALTGR